METKQVKRFSIALLLVAFALMIAAVFSFPATVFASTASKSSSDKLEINYTNANYEIQTDDTNGNYIIIPSANTTDIVATTANASKKKATIDLSVATKPRMYLVGNVSSYSIVYRLTNANNITSEETISVNLEQKDASFKFESNAKEIIPSQVQRSKQNTIVLPYPFIYVGEESDTPVNKDSTTGRPTDYAGLTVSLISPSASQIAIAKNAETGYYEFKVTDEAKFGKYTVRYTYSSATTETITKSFNFTIKDGEVKQVIKIDGYSSSLPSTIALFKETELPKPTVVNTENSNVEVSVYTNIYLAFTPTKSEEGSATTYTNDISKKGTEGYTYTASLNDFKFTPEVAGKFTVTYSVVDFFGNTAQQTSKIDAITAQKTAESGSGYIVGAYADFNTEKTAVENGEYVSAEYAIPSRVKTVNKDADPISSEEVWELPAIFGIDKQTTDSSKLTYTREISYTNSNNTQIVITFANAGQDMPASAVYTGSGTYKALANEVIPFRFTESTDYTVKYKVVDAANNTLFNKSFTVKAEKDYSDTRAPTVKFEGLNTTTVKEGQVLKFKASAEDTVSDTDATVADSRVEIVVKVKVNTGAETQIFADENGYYTYKTAGLNNEDQVTITAYAKDDYTKYNPLNEATLPKVVTIKKVTGTVVPNATEFDFDTETSHEVHWTISGDELQPVYSGDKVKLPSVTFSDANSPANTNLNVKVTAKVGSSVVYQTSANSGNSTSVTLGGEIFTVTRSGDYVVNYVVTDAAGNKIVKSFVFTVIGPEKAIINLGSFDSKYEFGTEINLRNLTVTLQKDSGSEDITDECTLITNISEAATAAEIKTAAQNAAAAGNAILVQIVGDGEVSDKDESMIIAGQNGTVTLNYWAVGNWTSAAEFDRNFTPEAKSVSFTVKDETKPTIIVDEGLIDDVVPYDSSQKGVYANMVKIPDMQKVYDLSGIQYGSEKITATYNSSDMDIVQINGKFTNTSGDVFYIGNNKVTINSVEYEYSETAQTLTHDSTVLNIVAGKVTIEAVEYTFVEETDFYGYVNAKGNGTVTLTYSATDKMGNTQTKTFTITVGDNTAPEINASQIESAIESQSFAKGDTVSIDLSKLSIIDDVSELTYENVIVKVTRDGEAVTVDISTDKKTASFKADEYGKYVISFDVKDSAGHSADTATVNFSITNSTNTKTASSTTVWGTVLIVVILVALGVIIFLFAKPSKSKQTVKLTDKKNDDKKE